MILKRLWWAMPLLLAGCAGLPPRSGCVAGNLHYSWNSRSPQGLASVSNCWGSDCPAFTAIVKLDEQGKVTEARCEPSQFSPMAQED